MINPLIYLLLLLKASFFSTGGLGNLPSIHQDFIALDWAHEEDFGKAIAVGQISPGPNGVWVVAFGYITYGWLGAFLALLAIAIPPLTVLGVNAIYNRIQEYPTVKGIMRGLTLAVVGTILTVAWSLVSAPSVDWKGWIIALVALAIGSTRKVSVLLILALAALAGYLIYGLG